MGAAVLSVVEKAIRLQDVDLFVDVPAEQLAYLAAIAEERSAEPGAPLFHDGDPADAMFLVLEGRVRLHRGDVEVTVCGPGEAFGTWALFDEEPRVMSATVLEAPVEMLQVDRSEFIEVLADNVEVTRAILRTVVRRLRTLGRAVGGRRTG